MILTNVFFNEGLCLTQVVVAEEGYAMPVFSRRIARFFGDSSCVIGGILAPLNSLLALLCGSFETYDPKLSNKVGRHCVNMSYVAPSIGGLLGRVHYFDCGFSIHTDEPIKRAGFIPDLIADSCVNSGLSWTHFSNTLVVVKRYKSKFHSAARIKNTLTLLLNKDVHNVLLCSNAIDVPEEIETKHHRYILCNQQDRNLTFYLYRSHSQEDLATHKDLLDVVHYEMRLKRPLNNFYETLTSEDQYIII